MTHIESQRKFEQMFPDRVPRVDLTRPAVKSPTTAERQAWRKTAPGEETRT